tara:strand:- start:592 stop:999 length:408 start_codon:yes stop_codon:yes gene_type:complete
MDTVKKARLTIDCLNKLENKLLNNIDKVEKKIKTCINNLDSLGSNLNGIERTLNDNEIDVCFNEIDEIRFKAEDKCNELLSFFHSQLEDVRTWIEDIKNDIEETNPKYKIYLNEDLQSCLNRYPKIQKTINKRSN